MQAKDKKSEYDELFAASYDDLVVWCARRYCRADRNAGADLVGTIYLKGMRSWNREKSGRGGFVGWVRKAIHRLVMDAARHKPEYVDVSDREDLVYTSPIATEIIVSKELAHLEAVAINCLSDKRRKIYLLQAEGLRTREIALALGMENKSVRNRLSEARKFVAREVAAFVRPDCKLPAGDDLSYCAYHGDESKKVV